MNPICLFFYQDLKKRLIFQISNGQERSISGDSRNFKLCPVKEVQSSLPPTMDSGRYSVQSLIDGKLPKDGWRSTWTAWFKVDPVVTFDLGDYKKIGIIRIYFQINFLVKSVIL